MGARWQRPLYRGHRLLQVTKTKFVWAKICDYESWLLNKGGGGGGGGSLNTRPFYTGPTVIKYVQRISCAVICHKKFIKQLIMHAPTSHVCFIESLYSLRYCGIFYSLLSY